MPGSVGGRRKRVRITRIPRRRPTLHDLTADQRQSLATIRTTNTALYRAYLLKEQLRAVFATKGRRGEQLLAGWIAWARRSRLHEFVALARTIKRFQQLIWNTPPQTWCVERTIRSHQHPHPSSDQTRLRLPLTRSPHRHGHAHPRRTQTRTPRPESLNRNGFPTTRGAPARSFRPSEVG